MHSRRYGLVISDWNMEPMTGYDLLRQVRADPGLGEIPFIMVTAESKTENVIAAKKAGVNNYIVKPFNAQTLKAKIEAVFAEKIEHISPKACRPDGYHFNPRVTAFGVTPPAAKMPSSASISGVWRPPYSSA